MINTEIFGTYYCPYCLQENDVQVDPTGGMAQTLTEDCTVCCRPILLSIRIDEASGEVDVESRPEV